MTTKTKPANKKSPASTAALLISAYVPALRGLSDYNNLWNPENKTFKPFSTLTREKRDELGVCEWLDAITLAVEAGVVPQEGWVEFLFGDEWVFRDFAECYSFYDQEYRTHDRWWQALSALAGGGDETAFVTSEEIAEHLLDYALETGQITPAD